MNNIFGVALRVIKREVGENPYSVLIVDSDGQELVLTLFDPWADIGDYIPNYTKIHVFNVKISEKKGKVYYSADKSSIVVVDPDILINASSISSISYCPRSYYIKEVMGDTAAPFSAVKGTIVHDALSTAISKRLKPSEVLSDVLNTYSIDYENFNYSKEKMQQVVSSMVGALDDFVESLPEDTIPEALFLSPMFGIRGRIDVLADIIYELKTAKLSPDIQDARFSDMMQVILYAYGIGVSSINDFDKLAGKLGSVIYVGSAEAILKDVEHSWGILRYAMQMRNLAYRISALGYIPPILSEEKAKRCKKCSLQLECSVICAGLSQFNNCSMCNHADICSRSALPNNYKEYFSKFYELLIAEKVESYRNMADLWNLGVNERYEKGKCITNLKLVDEINTDKSKRLLFSCQNNSEIREGDIVILSDGNVISKPISTGVVSNITPVSIEVETKATASRVSVIDLYFIDVGYRRQERGLFYLIFNNKNNFADLIVKNNPPDLKRVEGKFIPNNPTQNEAVSKILGTNNYLLIQGPAGTGKTHVIARAAIALSREYIHEKKQVLLTAFTNRAVDNMCKYLLENNYTNFVRLGSHHSIQEEIRPYTLDNLIKKYSLYEKGHLTIDDSQIIDDNSNNDDEFLTLKVTELLKNFPIIVATTSTISSPRYYNLPIKAVIMDEASQMTEPTALSALIKGDKFILVGDHKQLPPVVQSPRAQKGGLSVSLFERLALRHPSSIHLLTDQYRMNEKLMDFSNKVFYDNKLKTLHNNIALQNLLDLAEFVGDYNELENSEIYGPKTPLVLAHINGTFNPEKRINKEEAKIVAKIARNFLSLGLSVNQIGIIAPYRGQVSEIRRLVPQIDVDTVDRFQGSDREVIILSLTETGLISSKGFADERRLNVAITRAKKKLVVVGSHSYSYSGILRDYLSYLESTVPTIEIEKIPTKRKVPLVSIIPQETVIVAESLSKTAKFLKKVKLKSKDLIHSSDDKNKCMICYQQVYENGVECPFCGHIFHFKHLVDWVSENGRCPYCKTGLVIYQRPLGEY